MREVLTSLRETATYACEARKGRPAVLFSLFRYKEIAIGNKFSLGVRQASQAPLVVKGNINDLPDEFKKVTIEPDKKALRDAIKSSVEGIEQYAELGERSSYLSIR